MSPARVLRRAKRATRAALAEAPGLLLCQESWAFTIFVLLSVDGDELFGATSDLPYELLHIRFRGWWKRAKHDLSAVVLCEDAIWQEVMKVTIEI